MILILCINMLQIFCHASMVSHCSGRAKKKKKKKGHIEEDGM